jgi:hypothetical protein
MKEKDGRDGGRRQLEALTRRTLAVSNTSEVLKRCLDVTVSNRSNRSGDHVGGGERESEQKDGRVDGGRRQLEALTRRTLAVSNTSEVLKRCLDVAVSNTSNVSGDHVGGR